MRLVEVSGSCVVLIAALFTTGCGPRPTASVRIDPALATLIPSDTILLAGVRLDQLRKTPVYRKLASQSKFPGYERFVEQTGLDPKEDLWEMLAASNGKSAVLMARGKFSEEGGLEPRLKRPGVQRVPYKRHTLLGDERAALVFMNATTAVAAPMPDLKLFLDQQHASADLPQPIAERLRTISPESQIWAVAVGGFDRIPVPDSGNLANLGRIFESLASGTLGVIVGEGVQVTAVGDCLDAGGAKRLHDTARGLLGLARISTPQGETAMLRLIDGVTVQQEQARIRIRAEVAPDLVPAVESLLQKSPSRLPFGN